MVEMKLKGLRNFDRRHRFEQKGVSRNFKALFRVFQSPFFLLVHLVHFLPRFAATRSTGQVESCR